MYVPPSQRRNAAAEDRAGSKRNKQKENFVNPRDDPDYRRDERDSDKQQGRAGALGGSGKATSVVIGEDKPKKEKAPPTPGAKTTKEIKKALDANDIRTAMDLFHTRSEAGLVDAEASRALLHYCIKTPGALLDGFAVASYAKQKKYKICLLYTSDAADE